MTPDAQVYLEEDEEEDFQTVPLDDEHWTTGEVPKQNFLHTQTFLTTRTMPVPMSICKLPASFLC